MTEADKAPWTIKAMPSVARELATRRAKQAQQNVGDWLAAAIESHVEQERRASVIPPGQGGQTNQSVARYDPAPQPLDLLTLAQAVASVTAMAQAAAETPALRGLSRDVAGLLRDQVRQARGLPPVSRR